MGRRVRHFNPAHMGFRAYYDARFTAFSDGAAVDTWQNRVPGNPGITQATASDRPTFRANYFNGQPAIDFDGTDFMNSSTAGVSGVSRTTFVAACKCTRTTPTGSQMIDVVLSHSYRPGTASGRSGGNLALTNNWVTPSYYLALETGYGGNLNQSRASGDGVRCNGVLTAPFSGNAARNNNYVLVAVSPANCNTTDTALLAVSRFNDAGASTARFLGGVGAVGLHPGVLTAAQIRRIESSIGYSFKIPCS